MNYLKISNTSKISTIHHHLTNMFKHDHEIDVINLHVFSVFFYKGEMNKSLMLIVITKIFSALNVSI